MDEEARRKEGWGSSMRVEKRDEEAAINGESKEEATEGVKRDEKARRGREEG